MSLRSSAYSSSDIAGINSASGWISSAPTYATLAF
jgi:hypothetical protein